MDSQPISSGAHGVNPTIGHFGRCHWRALPGPLESAYLVTVQTLMSFRLPFVRALRTLHLYLGVFIAPMLIFFAVTGGLQTFGLHESSRGSSYEPPAWLASMAQLHKKQTTVVRQRRARPVPAEKPRVVAPAETGAVAERALVSGDHGTLPARNLWPMKIFFALVALGLLTSVLSGLYMAWRFSRKPRLVGAALLAGVMVPLLLLASG